MKHTVAVMALILMALPIVAQTNEDVNTLVLANVGAPDRVALSYRDGVFVTPANLESLGVDANSVVEVRHASQSMEARIFPIVSDGRRDTSIYMISSQRERLGVDRGQYRVEIVPVGAEGETLGAAQTDLPACGAPGTWVFQRVGMPPRESLELGEAVFVREDTFDRIGVEPGAMVEITIGDVSIEVSLHPLDREGRRETSIYIKRSLREALGIEPDAHQVALRVIEDEL